MNSTSYKSAGLKLLPWNKDLVLYVHVLRVKREADSGPDFVTLQVPRRFMWKHTSKYFPHQGNQERARRAS